MQVNAAMAASGILAVGHKESTMPTETIVTVAVIVAIFAVFGAVLSWGDRQTRKSA